MAEVAKFWRLLTSYMIRVIDVAPALTLVSVTVVEPGVITGA